MTMRNRLGFTLIELLVVIAIVGVLAAIAIPVYARYKASGIDAQMVSALRNARTAAEAFYLSNGDTYELLTVPSLEANGYRPTIGVTLKIEDPEVNSYKIRACASGGSSPAFLVDSNDGAAAPNYGTCS